MKCLSALIIFAFISLVFESTAVAQSLNDLSKEELIHRLLDSQRVEETVRATMEATTETNMANPMMGMLPEEKMEEIINVTNDIIDEYMSPEILRQEIYLPVYDSLYTKDELVTLIPIIESAPYQAMLDKNLAGISDIANRTAEITARMTPAMMEAMMKLMGAEEALEEMVNPKGN